MIKNILVALIIVIGVTGVGSAGDTYFIYDGSGTDSFSWSGNCNERVIAKTSGTGSPFYYQAHASISGTASYIPLPWQRSVTTECKGGTNVWYSEYNATYIGEPLSLSGNAAGYLVNQGGGSYTGGNYELEVVSGCDSTISHYVSVVCSEIPFVIGISGNTCGVDGVTCYINTTGSYIKNNFVDLTETNYYEFNITTNTDYKLIFSNGHEYEFTYSGTHIVYDYDVCIWVYGYTCGIDTVKLYDNNSQLIDTVSQSSGYDTYEMQIADGMEYTISFYDLGILLCHNQTFTCAGDHVRIDYDRCEWVYPPYPPAPPYIIYLWSGYDYNIVVFKDEHGNFIENSQLAIYDKTDNQYLQRWTDAADGYTLLGARFNTDHDVLLSLRTFDGIFTFDTTYPANGSAPVGEENITTTNWTIPIKYNLNVLPVDQYGASIFDVFCGLSEYTPLNPEAFWGMDLSDRGYVAVTNCSGFAMCDIIAEKEGYADYKVEALNWTSKSALVKDYRHNIVMEEE